MDALRTETAEMALRGQEAPTRGTRGSARRGPWPIPWPPEPRERCDFYYRTRTFPEDVLAWRRRLVARVIENRRLFPGVPRGATHEEIRALVDEGIAFSVRSRASPRSCTAVRG